MSPKTVLVALLLVLAGVPAGSQPQDSPKQTRSKLLVVGTAHLDTQWRWTVRNSIEEYIPETFRRNIALMERYPDYVFSFEGAFRYMLMKEYYRDEFERVRPFVESGQWRVTGSWLDAVDVNIPSFESLVRHTLYGNGYFRREFGKTSRDIFLPDCFGFGYALPSIAAHCGLKSFSTQKLEWGCWVGIPFDIGIWKGVDGSSLVCGVNPGAYVSEIEADLSRDTTWLKAAERLGEQSGLYAAYRYFGTGDTGGSPDSASVDWLDKSSKSDGPLEVISVGADDIVDLVSGIDPASLPHYDGELVMTRHGAGCYTSQAAMKRWNRKNELLADAVERASVISYRLGAAEYPSEMLQDTWIRFLWHQFHDDLTGTSIPEAYEFSWSDEILCQNRFSAMLTHAVEAASGSLDTRGKGVSLIVFNPLAVVREDIVEATVHFDNKKVTHVRVYGPDGREVPSDAVVAAGDSLRISFLATVPSVGYAVFDARPSDQPCPLETGLRVSPRSLENRRYRVTINDAGEVASIFDKQESRELLAAPVRFELLEDTPHNWPAWEIDFDDISSRPLDIWVGAPVIAVEEEGCARVALRIEQQTANSVLRTVVRLSAGAAGDRVEFDSDIDWYDREKMLKLAVSPAAANEMVTYDLGLGVIERGRNTEKRYEVPGHQWADLTAPDGAYGIALLNDSRYGWDHPDSTTVRLTLVRTPGISEGWNWVGDQRSQDLGHHEFAFAIHGHAGDWREGGVVWQAARFNQPLLAFQAPSHTGDLGKTHSLLTVRPAGVSSDAEPLSDQPPLLVNAVKIAEESDELIIRVRELNGSTLSGAAISFDRPIASAREVNGAEEEVGPAEVTDGTLLVSLTPYQPRAFALRFSSPGAAEPRLSRYAPLDLPYTVDGISTDENRCDGDFDGSGNSLAGDLLADTVTYLDIPFVVGPNGPGTPNIVTCQGQNIALPTGEHNRLYILAASTNGPASASFGVDGRSYPVELPDYAEPIGQWDNRVAGDQLFESWREIAPAYINRVPVAWYGSHRHTPACENDIYRFTYLFFVELNIPTGAKTLTLPSEDRIRVVAATLGIKPDGNVVPSQPLYDETRNTVVKISADSSAFAGACRLTMVSPIPAASIYYTLDGSEPSTASSLYTGPFTVDRTTTVRARAMRDGYNSEHVATREVTRLTLKDAVAADGLAAGLNARYFEGEWDRLPGFDTLAPVTAFVADAIGIPEFARDEDYGLEFQGFVQVPVDGIYAFSINSDDGSRLYVADTLLVDNDGLHGDSEATGLIGLKAGLHVFKAQMFQCKGGEALGATIAGPSLRKQSLPVTMLLHRGD